MAMKPGRLTIVMVVLSFLVAVGGYMLLRQQLQETRVAELRAVAFYYRTPVPDFFAWMAQANVRFPIGLSTPEWFEPLGYLFFNMSRSSGVWHVAVENAGDAVARNTRVRAPGAFFARRGRSGQEGFTWGEVANESVEVGDILPGDRFTVLLWLDEGRYLRERCPTGAPGCFTKDELSVSGENTTTAFYFADVEEPFLEELRWWDWHPWLVLLFWGVIALTLVEVGRRIPRGRDRPAEN